MSKYLDYDGLSHFKDKLDNNFLNKSINPVVSTTIESTAVLSDDETADITSLATATVAQGSWITTEGTDEEDYDTWYGSTYYYGYTTATVTATLSEVQEADTTVIAKVAISKIKADVDSEEDDGTPVWNYLSYTQNVTVTIPAGSTSASTTFKYGGYSSGTVSSSVVSATTSAYTEQQTLTVKYLDGTTVSYTFNSVIVSTSSSSTLGYKVTFVSNGEAYQITEVTAGNSVSAPSAPTLDGYTFSGWSLEENGDIISFPYTPTTDITLYAVFESNPSVTTTVLLDSNGEEITDSDGNAIEATT